MGLLSEGGLLGGDPERNGGILGGASAVAAGGLGGYGSASGGYGFGGSSRGGFGGYGSASGGLGQNAGQGFSGSASSGGGYGGGFGGGLGQNAGQGFSGSASTGFGGGGQFGGGGIGGSAQGGLGGFGSAAGGLSNVGGLGGNAGAGFGGFGSGAGTLGGPVNGISGSAQGGIDPATAFAINHILDRPQQIQSPSANSLGPTTYGMPSTVSPSFQSPSDMGAAALQAAGINPATASVGDLIGAAEQAYGLPQGLLQHLVNQESGFNTHARNKKSGAQGLGQLMPATATELGVTNAYDPTQNIFGSAKYLGQMIDQFGSVPKALAAYNGGPGRLRSVGGDISRMPKESRNYVSSIMGAWGRSAPVSGTQFAGPGVPQPQPAIDMTRAQPIPTPMEMGGSGSAFVNPASSTPEQPGLSSPNVPAVHEVQPSGGGLLGGLYNDYIAPKVAEARNAINYGFQHPTLTRMAAALSGYGGPAYQSPDVGGLNPPNDRPRTVAEAIRKARKKKPSDILNWNVQYTPNPVA